jgi:hypothetical protein
MQCPFDVGGIPPHRACLRQPTGSPSPRHLEPGKPSADQRFEPVEPNLSRTRRDRICSPRGDDSKLRALQSRDHRRGYTFQRLRDDGIELTSVVTNRPSARMTHRLFTRRKCLQPLLPQQRFPSCPRSVLLAHRRRRPPRTERTRSSRRHSQQSPRPVPGSGDLTWHRHGCAGTLRSQLADRSAAGQRRIADQLRKDLTRVNAFDAGHLHVLDAYPASKSYGAPTQRRSMVSRLPTATSPSAAGAIRRTS